MAHFVHVTIIKTGRIIQLYTGVSFDHLMKMTKTTKIYQDICHATLVGSATNNNIELIDPSINSQCVIDLNIRIVENLH